MSGTGIFFLSMIRGLIKNVLSVSLNIVIADNQTCLVCIARRLPVTEKSNMMIGIEHFTTKQDLSGKIISNDTRWVLVVSVSSGC